MCRRLDLPLLSQKAPGNTRLVEFSSAVLSLNKMTITMPPTPDKNDLVGTYVVYLLLLAQLLRERKEEERRGEADILFRQIDGSILRGEWTKS